MKKITQILKTLLIACVLVMGSALPAAAHTTSGQVREVQTILSKYGIPTGPIDGIWGPKTAQGVCTFRQISGLPVSRGSLTAADITKARQFKAAYSSLGSIPAPSRRGYGSYLLVNKTCQTMSFVRDNKFHKIFRVSTGKIGYDTRAGNFWLGSTRPGWSCSTLYPESCYNYSQGINAKTTQRGVLYSTYGNMYNKRVISGAVMLHGSGSVPTYPASHGCVRTTVADSDWLYRNVSNAGGVVYMSVVGRY